jgi:hypothetical protein
LKKPNTPAYAVIRLDYFLVDGDLDAALPAATHLERAVTVKEILLDRERAEVEVDRLNKVNANKRCRYFWQYTRLVTERE